MDTIQTLGAALGLSALAGIDLYITVFFTGLAIRLHWLHLTPQMHSLNTLADPLVLTVAGVMLVVEFIIDKCPYADSAWDVIHTIVRPMGGAILGMKALGSLDPHFETVGLLLGGSVAFTTHTAKAGTRVWVNTSPEPFSNIAVSVGEDVGVLGGLWFVFKHPVWTALIVVILVVAFWYFFPKFYRLVRAHGTALIHRLGASDHEARAMDSPLPGLLPGYAAESWMAQAKKGETLVWLLPCFSGQWKVPGKNMGGYVQGCLLATSEGRLFFIGKKNFRTRLQEIPLRATRVYEEAGHLYHQLIFLTETEETLRVRFTRKYSGYLPKAHSWFEQQGATPQRPAVEPSLDRVPATVR